MTRVFVLVPRSDSARLAAPPAPPGMGMPDREQLLDMLVHQQRLAQEGLVTAGLSHDLTSQILALSGTACVALRSPRPEDWRDALRGVEGQCMALNETLSAFLAFAGRGESSSRSTFRISDAVQQAGRLVGPLARTAGVALCVRTCADAEVRGEVRIAVQALVNLASNAIQAADGPDAKVSVAGTLGRHGRAFLRVCDNGPGIPEHVRETMFRPFAGRGTERGRSGLGLFIVRQAVRRLGGTIRVETSVEGTSVLIDLPVGCAD